MKPKTRTEAWGIILSYCDGDVEAVSLLIEQVRYEIPPMPPDNIRDAIAVWTDPGYEPEWSVVG